MARADADSVERSVSQKICRQPILKLAFAKLASVEPTGPRRRAVRPVILAKVTPFLLFKPSQ